MQCNEHFQEQPYRDIASQIQLIDKTFDDVRPSCTQHHSKPGVVAIEELPLLPDLQLWKYPFAQVGYSILFYILYDYSTYIDN